LIDAREGVRAGYHLNDNSAETIKDFIEHFSGSAKNPVRCRRRLIGIFVLQNTDGRPRSAGPPSEGVGRHWREADTLSAT